MPYVYKGQELTKDILNIFITDDNCNYINPFSITYTIFQRLQNFAIEQVKRKMNVYNIIGDASFVVQQVNSVAIEMPIKETIGSVPVPYGVGKFYAAWIMPFDIEIGPYRIHWYTQKYSDSPILESIEEFNIVAKSTFSADATGTTMHQSFTGGPAL
jgi:hypothetical protein